MCAHTGVTVQACGCQGTVCRSCSFPSTFWGLNLGHRPLWQASSPAEAYCCGAAETHGEQKREMLNWGENLAGSREQGTPGETGKPRPSGSTTLQWGWVPSCPPALPSGRGTDLASASAPGLQLVWLCFYVHLRHLTK